MPKAFEARRSAGLPVTPITLRSRNVYQTAAQARCSRSTRMAAATDVRQLLEETWRRLTGGVRASLRTANDDLRRPQHGLSRTTAEGGPSGGAALSRPHEAGAASARRFAQNAAACASAKPSTSAR